MSLRVADLPTVPRRRDVEREHGNAKKQIEFTEHVSPVISDE